MQSDVPNPHAHDHPHADAPSEAIPPASPTLHWQRTAGTDNSLHHRRRTSATAGPSSPTTTVRLVIASVYDDLHSRKEGTAWELQTSVGEVKDRLVEDGWNRQDMRLIWQGRILQDEQTLEEVLVDVGVLCASRVGSNHRLTKPKPIHSISSGIGLIPLRDQPISDAVSSIGHHPGYQGETLLPPQSHSTISPSSIRSTTYFSWPVITSFASLAQNR